MCDHFGSQTVAIVCRLRGSHVSPLDQCNESYVGSAECEQFANSSIGADCLRLDRGGLMLTVEFTVEPFVDGSPGPHVIAAVEAVEAHGFSVDFGPFGTSFTVPEDRVPEVVADLLRAAYANGATYVSVDVGKLDLL
jgi:uncharacterized protein YqgV (UPF0045/DUF77 family)